MKKQGKSQIQPPKALQFHDPKRTVKKVTISPTLQFHEFSEHESTKFFTNISQLKTGNSFLIGKKRQFIFSQF